MIKFSKVCFKRFHYDTDRRVVFKCRKIWRTGNGEIVRCLLDKKQFRLAGSPAVAADGAQNVPI